MKTKTGMGIGMAAAAVGVGTWLAGAGVATATLPIQKQAKAANYPATSCIYCHADKLPKKGASAFNDRGKWLHEEKEKRKAKDVDAAWLKDYVEKKPDEKK